MPLSVLVPMVVIGLSIGLLAIHFLGGAIKPAIASGDQVRKRFLVDFPDAKIDRVELSDDRQSALLFGPNIRPVGLVTAFGSKLITRKFNIDHLPEIVENSEGLNIQIGEITFKTARFLSKSETKLVEIAALFESNSERRKTS